MEPGLYKKGRNLERGGGLKKIEPPLSEKAAPISVVILRPGHLLGQPPPIPVMLERIVVRTTRHRQAIIPGKNKKTMQNAIAVGSRIALRPLTRADAAAFVPWVNDPEVTRTLAIGARAMDVRAEEVFIEKMNASTYDVLFGIVVRETDRLIGSTGLSQIDLRNQNASFGMMIGEKSAWGKGYGTEATRLVVRYAFEELHLNRVQLHVYAYNLRGIRVYEKVGFRREGVLRQAHVYDNRFWDTVVMAMLREEWENRWSMVSG